MKQGLFFEEENYVGHPNSMGGNCVPDRSDNREGTPPPQGSIIGVVMRDPKGEIDSGPGRLIGDIVRAIRKARGIIGIEELKKGLRRAHEAEVQKVADDFLRNWEFKNRRKAMACSPWCNERHAQGKGCQGCVHLHWCMKYILDMNDYAQAMKEEQ